MGFTGSPARGVFFEDKVRNKVKSKLAFAPCPHSPFW
jgi:hypothetical protein